MERWKPEYISDMIRHRQRDDIWFNGYHVTMPSGLMNDPNGLAYFKGEYYIFYQWNPYGCEHKHKCWGYTRTKDFVSYSNPEIVMYPDEWFDKDGCYSGNAIVTNHILHLFYTGNVKGADGERISYQCLAEVDDERSLSGQGPVIRKQGPVIRSQEDGYTAHFRDPMVFEDHGHYFMILGIQTIEEKGRAVVYRSDDLRRWNFCGELGTDYDSFGFMWECPNLLKLEDDTYALIFSVQGLKPDGERYRNMYQSGYITGSLDWESLRLEHHSSYEEIDKGFDFYAPQVFKHEDQYIMMGWAGNGYQDSREYPSIEHGWVFSLTLPRMLQYKKGRLYQIPLACLENLRERLIFEGDIVLGKRMALPDRTLELALNLIPGEQAEIKICFSEEYIAVRYDSQRGICEIDREHMKLGARGVRRFALDVQDSWNVHLFMDSSVMEFFFQDGQETATVMYFPQGKETALQLSCEKIISGHIWQLRKIVYE